MLNKKRSFAILVSAILLQHAQANSLQNFNEPNTAKILQALQEKKLHVVQLGDSHTAADEMTDALRSQLQSSLGNGGLGWAMPMYFSGQRMALYGYDNNGWQPLSSRSQREYDYTLGGFIAKPLRQHATLTLKAKRYAPVQQFTVAIKQGAEDGALTGIDVRGQQFSLEAPVKNGTWQTVKFTAQLPFTIQNTQGNNSAIGGWWGKNIEGSGAVVSALGINGAELSFWNRWNRSAIQHEISAIAPELMILAYGTNEAYNENLDIDYSRSILVDKIQQIRQASPNTAVLIVSAPEALKQTAGECGTRPTKLSAFQTMQLQVAQSQKTFYWNWQSAMGGQCSMKRWIQQGLALKDGIHFSGEGYQRLGRLLANDILDIGNLRANTSSSSVQQTAPIYGIAPATNIGYAKICLEGSQECKSLSY